MITKRRLGASLAALSIFLCNTSWGGITVPPNEIDLAVRPGTVSFFQIALSGVPAGFSVANKTYSAWCVDRYNDNNPADDGGLRKGYLLDVTAGGLPSNYNDVPWDKINYLLNHQRGTIDDVQHAIWYYTDGVTPDTTLAPLAPDLIRETDLNGVGFKPTGEQVSAALVVWTFPKSDVQGNIIEVPGAPDITDGTCEDRFTAGGFIFRDGQKVTFGIQGGVKNGSLAGGVNLIDHGLNMHVKSRSVLRYTVIDANCRQAVYDCTIDGAPGTATVVACDYGEPGRDDVLEITLSNGYTAGQGSTLGADGPGGGNVQLHKGKCKEPPKAKKCPPGKKPTKPAKPSIPVKPTKGGSSHGKGK